VADDVRRVAIVGGYGVVGGWLGRHLTAAGHELDLVIAGRDPAKGADLAAELGARTARVDGADPEPGLAALGEVDLVVSALQDPDDVLLRAALRAGAGYLGLVRKAHNLGPTAMAATMLARRPVLIHGHWQAGVLTLAALAAAAGFDRVDRVELAGLFDPADQAGPMATADSGSFFGRALLRRDGSWVELAPEDGVRLVERGGPAAFPAQPMGTLDVIGVATATGAADVRFDLGVGESAGTLAGGPASHEVFADLWGTGRDGRPRQHRTVVSDPLGQSHLTALGALLGVERALGLDGGAPLPPGLHFPDAVLDPARALARLRHFGVTIDESHH
jgi:hypothetical protein